MKFVIVKREVVTTTRVYEVDIDPDTPAYPTRFQRAVSATDNALPVSEDSVRRVNFTTMEKKDNASHI
jgi:hypothetical protein